MKSKPNKETFWGVAKFEPNKSLETLSQQSIIIIISIYMANLVCADRAERNESVVISLVCLIVQCGVCGNMPRYCAGIDLA